MRATALAAFLLVAPTMAAAQTASDGHPLAGFDAYVEQAVHDWDVPGLAIAVVKDDSVVFAKGYGVRALGSNAPVDLHTLFANASTTKAFTAMAVAMMVDEGVLGWDDPVSDHLPTFILYDPYVTREVTVRDLLTHRIGFGDPFYLWYGVDLDYQEMVRRLRDVEPQSSFRARYAYNNVSYATAGIIAGQSNGTSWDELVQQRILGPLGMSETVTQKLALSGRDNVAHPHDYVDDSLQVIPDDGIGLVDPIGPAGSMYSSVANMTEWLRFLLNEGRVGDEQLVSDAAFAELFRPQVIVPADRFYPTARLTQPHFTAYGLGWFLQDYRGEFVAFHTGSIDGTVAIVGLIPEHELGVVVFANRDHAELRHALMFRLFDAYLGEPQRDWSAEMREMYEELAARGEERLAQLEAGRVHGTTPTLPLDEYAGVYAGNPYGSVEVRFEGGSLVMERSEFLTADLSHWHYDTFRAHWRNRWIDPGLVSFHLGSDGEVASLEFFGMSLAKEPEEDSEPGNR
ncbi:MAG: serine hydrolase [Gemmatimonadota bacterium]|nr:MAG: serine hydrolase [Gemmatimonadota bacterium]